MSKLFIIEDYTKDDGKIILFCLKGKLQFEITFDAEKFIDWMRDTDRFSTLMMEYVGGEAIGETEVMMSEDEYWSNCAYLSICNDLYEYVVLRLVAPHKLFNGTETALLTILNTASC